MPRPTRRQPRFGTPARVPNTTEQSSSPIQVGSDLRIEGIALAASGALFLAKAFFDLKVGEPPSGGREIVEWVAAEKLSLSMTNEILVIASLLLVPGLIGLYSSLVGFDRRKTTTGCGIVAMLIPVIVALACVHGRFVYPVYGIDLNEPSVIQLVASIYYGGQHAVLLLFGVATILLSLAMRNTPYGKTVVFLGLTTGAMDLVGAYPWLIGPALTFVSEALFALWFIAVGVRLAGSHWRQVATL